MSTSVPRITARSGTNTVPAMPIIPMTPNTACATSVAAGAIARKLLDRLYGKVLIRGALVQMGTQKIDRANWSWTAVDENPFFCPDPKAAVAWEGYLEGIRKAGSSV